MTEAADTSSPARPARAARRAPDDLPFTFVDAALVATISYFADEFDPTAWQAPARAATIDGTRIGGLGIQLVRSLMDEFGYAYDAGLNVVSLRKRW